MAASSGWAQREVTNNVWQDDLSYKSVSILIFKRVYPVMTSGQDNSNVKYQKF